MSILNPEITVFLADIGYLVKLLSNCYKKIYERPKVSIQIIKNAESLNTNNQKCKKKQVQTNKRTLIL